MHGILRIQKPNTMDSIQFDLTNGEDWWQSAHNKKMDNFNDDFWTNGEFQNLYSTSDSYDEYNSYDANIDTNWYQSEGMFGTLFQNIAIDQLNETNSYANDFVLENQQCQSYSQSSHSSYDHQSQVDDANNFENVTQIFLTDMDDWKQKSLNEMMYQTDTNNNISNNWETNIDDLLFDSSCDMTNYHTDLPARTLYCNDSCTNVLAEATENLQTFRSAYEPVEGQSVANGTSISGVNAKSQDKFHHRNGVGGAEEKEFICTYGDCRKVYAKAGHLKAHIRRHNGDKPYECRWPNCTWRFSRSDELSRHHRSHSGIKPYKCSYCPKCFSRSDHLTKHRKVHERKMAAMKVKAVWNQLPPRKPGRKPKSQLAKEING